MTWPVYSRRVFSYQLTVHGAWTPVYTVPDENTLIVRTVTAATSSAVSDQLFFGESGIRTWHTFKGVSTDPIEEWNTWVVFNAGDTIGLFAVASDWSVTCHGQLLSNPP
jgi:hypothetical protein